MPPGTASVTVFVDQGHPDRYVPLNQERCGMLTQSLGKEMRQRRHCATSKPNIKGIIKQLSVEYLFCFFSFDMSS